MRLTNLLPLLGTPHFHALCLIFASTAAVESFVAIWAASSRPFWFWRALALWLAVMALAPIRAYEPAMTFAISSPLIALLIILQQFYIALWNSKFLAQSGPGNGHIRFTMRDLLLVMALVGLSLAGMLQLVRHIHYPTRTNYALNIAAITFVTLAAANVAFAKRRLFSLVVLALVIAASAIAIPMLGSVPDTYDALGLLDVGFHPSHLVASACNLAIFFSELAALLVAALRLPQAVQRVPQTANARIARRVLVVGALLAIPMALVYWQMLWLSPLPPPFSTGPNNYDRIRELAGNVVELANVPGPTAKQQRDAFISEVTTLADVPNYVPFDPNPGPNRISVDAYVAREARVFRDLARKLENDAGSAYAGGNRASALTLRLTNIRLGVMLQRGSEEATYLIGRAVEGGTLEQLIRIRRDLTADEAKTVIAALQRALDEREGPETVVARDRAIAERAYGWGCRLENVLAQIGLESDMYPAFLMVTRERPEFIRMLQTDLAIRLYQHDHGRLPQSLDDLVPNYLPAVPIDLHSDQPFVYRPNADDFLLYSVGQDGVDNSGKLTNNRTYYFGIDKGDHRNFGAGYDFDLDTLTRQ